jgi:hypothetical protein
MSKTYPDGAEIGPIPCCPDRCGEVDHFRKVARVGDMGVDVSYVLSWPNEKRYLEAFRGYRYLEDYAVFVSD